MQPGKVGLLIGAGAVSGRGRGPGKLPPQLLWVGLRAGGSRFPRALAVVSHVHWQAFPMRTGRRKQVMI